MRVQDRNEIDSDLKEIFLSLTREHAVNQFTEIFENRGREVDVERIRTEKDHEIAGLKATMQ